MRHPVPKRLLAESEEAMKGPSIKFVIAPGARTRMISIRLPGGLIDRYREHARRCGDVPYQRLMRQALEREIERRERQWIKLIERRLIERRSR